MLTFRMIFECFQTHPNASKSRFKSQNHSKITKNVKNSIFFEIWLGMVPRSSGIHSEHSPMSKIKPNIAKNLKIKSKKSKIEKKLINFKKSFGWKPYGGKSGSLKTMVILSRPDFKVFGPKFNENHTPPRRPPLPRR